MFRKLRNHLVLVNIIITTTVLVIAFATIYIVAKNSTEKRMIPRGEPDMALTEMRGFEDRMRHDRQESLNSLLVSLVVIGVMMEVAVVVLSYYLAEVAIRPVQKTYDTQKTFIANASHEIKTPLAAITANLEAANIQGNRWLDNVNKEVQLLTTLNGELLQLAQADNLANHSGQKSEVAVQKVLDEVRAPFAAKIKTQKMKLKVQILPKDVMVNVVEIDLRQVLTILLDNAIKYGRKELEMCYENAAFLVKNDGATIPAEKLAQVFERFYQVDKSAEGSGLGLAIAKSLAERNGWSLELASENNETVAKLKIR